MSSQNPLGRLDRRRFLQGAGGLVAAPALSSLALSTRSHAADLPSDLSPEQALAELEKGQVVHLTLDDQRAFLFPKGISTFV